MVLSLGSLAAIYLGAVYFACCLAGYGNDFDTNAMIRSGQNLLNGLGYSPSRAPGYPVPEIVIGAASRIGGSILLNSISVVLGLGSLSLFYLLALRHLKPNRAGFAVLFVARLGQEPLRSPRPTPKGICMMSNQNIATGNQSA